LEGKVEQTFTQFRRNRFYDPVTGRFTQPDPIGLAGGVNDYGFANGDPVSFSDPFGLVPCPDRIAALRTRVATIRNRVADYLNAAGRGINDQNHFDKIDEEIQGFNNDLDAYHRDKRGCDDDDDFRGLKQEGVQLENTPRPAPVMRYGPRRTRDWQSDLQERVNNFTSNVEDLVERIGRALGPAGASPPRGALLPPPPPWWAVPAP
jgi:RHS repeat-associated protein